MAAGVVDADGVTNEAERTFMQDLASTLKLLEPTSQDVLQRADDLASSPVNAPANVPTVSAEIPKEPATESVDDSNSTDFQPGSCNLKLRP